MVKQQVLALLVVGSNPGGTTLFGGGGGIIRRPGFELPTKKSAARCITIRPPLDTRIKCVPTTWCRVYH